MQPQAFSPNVLYIIYTNTPGPDYRNAHVCQWVSARAYKRNDNKKKAYAFTFVKYKRMWISTVTFLLSSYYIKWLWHFVTFRENFSKLISVVNKRKSWLVNFWYGKDEQSPVWNQWIRLVCEDSFNDNFKVEHTWSDLVEKKMLNQFHFKQTISVIFITFSIVL